MPSASLCAVHPVVGDDHRISPGNVVALIGAVITLVGAIKSLVPLGGVKAVFPPAVHRAVRAVGRRLRRPQVRHINLHDSAVAIDTVATVTAAGIMLPNPVSDTDRFIAALAGQLGDLGTAVDDTRAALATERADQVAAVQAARDAAAAGLADAVANTERVELSGVRWQLVGVVFVVAGIVADAIGGG